jgi:hypothetical protein
MELVSSNKYSPGVCMSSKSVRAILHHITGPAKRGLLSSSAWSAFTCVGCKRITTGYTNNEALEVTTLYFLILYNCMATMGISQVGATEALFGGPCFKNLTFVQTFFCVTEYEITLRSRSSGMWPVWYGTYKRFGRTCCLHLQVRCWSKQVPLRRWYLSTILYGATSEKTKIPNTQHRENRRSHKITWPRRFCIYLSVRGQNSMIIVTKQAQFGTFEISKLQHKLHRTNSMVLESESSTSLTRWIPGWAGLIRSIVQPLQSVIRLNTR